MCVGEVEYLSRVIYITTVMACIDETSDWPGVVPASSAGYSDASP